MVRSITITSDRRTSNQLSKFKKLRKSAIENGTNVQDIIENEEEILEPTENHTSGTETNLANSVIESKQLKRKSNNLIENSLRNIGERGNSQITLDEIVNEVNKSSRGETTNLIQKGEISKELYELAEERRGVSQTTRNTGIVNPKNLAKVLGVDINESDSEHIVGILDEDYVKNNYQFNADDFAFADEEGVKSNIEGIRSWDSEEKEQARQILAVYVQEDLLNPLYEGKNKLESELESIQDELRTYNEKVQSGFILHAEPGILNALNRNYSEFKDMKRIPGVELDLSGEKRWEVRWTNKESKERIEAFVKYLKEISNKNNPLGKIKIKELKEKRKGGNKKELKERSKNLTTKLNKLEAKERINYLGLEGPSFGSYFQLASLFELPENQQLEFKAIIPEKGYRESNLMDSLVETYKGDEKLNGLFDNVEIVRQRNIDDLILLDFVKNPEISLKWKGTLEESIVRYGENEEIFLDNYHRLIDTIDQGSKKTDRELMKEYEISQEFLEATRDRYDEKLDIVFLDYLGGENEKKYAVTERLIPKLADNSVLAITTNESNKVHKNEDNPQWVRILETEEIDVEKHDNKSYKRGGSPKEMNIDVYHITKKNE